MIIVVCYAQIALNKHQSAYMFIIIHCLQKCLFIVWIYFWVIVSSCMGNCVTCYIDRFCFVYLDCHSVVFQPLSLISSRKKINPQVRIDLCGLRKLQIQNLDFFLKVPFILYYTWLCDKNRTLFQRSKLLQHSLRVVVLNHHAIVDTTYLERS